MRSRKICAPILEPVCIHSDDEKDHECGDMCYIIFPGLIVHGSEHGIGAGLGVFLTNDVHAGLKIPTTGTMLTQDDFDQKEEQNKVTHVYTNKVIGTPFLYLDGHPDQCPHMVVVCTSQ